MDLGVRDRAYLVFGGTAGMGRAAARALAADGARVAIAGRGRQRADQAAAEISAATGAPVVALTGDLTAPGAAESIMAEAVDRLGGLRGMAATTGQGLRGQHDLLTGSDDDWAAEDWGMHVALGRAGRPEEVGDVIAFLLSERASYLTGATVNVDGGTDF